MLARDDRLRHILMAILVFGAIGSGVDLFLLDHTESWIQLAPVAVLALILSSAVWLFLRPGPTSVRALRGVGALATVVGLVGMYLHYSVNSEFELEMYPSMNGGELFWEAAQGALPALAPGQMIQLGLLCLASCYRHPGANRG